MRTLITLVLVGTLSCIGPTLSDPGHVTELTATANAGIPGHVTMRSTLPDSGSRVA